jgi:hypothetical protein
MAAFEKAFKEGDTDVIAHLQGMYPKVYEMLQSKIISSPELDGMDYQQKLKMQRISGTPIAKTSDRAARAARSVFAPVEQKQGKNPKITGPALTTGAAIQDK